MSSKQRNALLQIYPSALDAVKGDHAVKRSLKELDHQHKCHLVAIGKAAEAMSIGALEHLQDKIVSGIIISKHDHFDSMLPDDDRFICIEADHPVPKEASLHAGAQLLRYLESLDKNAHCLILISGGASSLAEVLREGWTLDDLQEITRYLLANGYPIDEINATRRYISKIKAGGLWQYLDQQHVTCLMISDVQGNSPAVIGSGLLFPSDKPFPKDLPKKWQLRFQPLAPIYLPDFDWHIIATLEHAKQQAAIKARELGYSVTISEQFLDGDAAEVAQQCIEQLKDAETDIIIWGGETTVNLPENPPVGGRNQHFALAAAVAIQDCDCALISLGTDGTDGTSNAAGGLVDNQSVLQGKHRNMKAEDYLKSCNAYAFLKANGDLIVTGATGTNVMDLVIGIKTPA